MAKSIIDYPFAVRQIGTEVSIKGYDDKKSAEDSVKDRDGRAEALGLKARYEVVEGPRQ